MKKTFLITVVAAFAACFTGCTNLPSVAKALSKDPAFVTLQVRTIYGTAFFTRDGRPLSGDTVTPEGAVTSTPTATPPPQQVRLSPAQLQQLIGADAAALTPRPQVPHASSTNSPPATP